MTINTIADIVGDGAKHALATATGSTGNPRARKLFLTSTGGASRYGDTNVAAARGVSLPTGVEVTISASEADPADLIDLTTQYVFVPNGATVTVSWGQ